MVYDQLPISEKFTIELTRKQTALSTLLLIKQQVPENNNQMSLKISYPDLNQNIDELVTIAIAKLEEFKGDYFRACEAENSQTRLQDFEGSKPASLKEIAERARAKEVQDTVESEQKKAKSKATKASTKSK